MPNQCTLDKLHALKVTGMVAAYEKQLEDPEIHRLSFEERFGLAVGLPLDLARELRAGAPTPQAQSNKALMS